MDARPPVTQMPGVSSRGWTYLGVNILFLFLVTVVVAARFWSRRLTKARYGWDDWLILGALVVYCGQFSFNVWVIRNGGLGHHVSELPNIGVENTFLQLTISQFIYAVNFILIRFSICMLLMRIFPQRWLRHSMYICMAVTIAWALFVIISALTICTPISYNWDLSVPGGHCNNTIKLNTYIVNSAWTIVYDAAILCIPQVLIWRLQMPRATRAGVSMILALGVFDIVMSIVRITAVVEVNFEDVTFADYNAQIWTVVEVSVAIIVACLPLCRWVLDLVLPRSLLSSARRSEQRSTVNNASQVTHQGQESWHARKVGDSYRTFDEEDDTIELTAQKHKFSIPSTEYIETDEKDLEAGRLGNTAAATTGTVHADSPKNGIAVERNTTVTYG